MADIFIPREHLEDAGIVSRDGDLRELGYFLSPKLLAAAGTMDWDTIAQRADTLKEDRSIDPELGFGYKLCSEATHYAERFIQKPALPESLQNAFDLLLNITNPTDDEGLSLKSTQWAQVQQAEHDLGHFMLDALGTQMGNMAEALRKNRSSDDTLSAVGKAGEYALFFIEGENFGFTRDNPFTLLQMVEAKPYADQLYYENDFSVPARVSMKQQDAILRATTESFATVSQQMSDLFGNARTSYPHTGQNNSTSAEASKHKALCELADTLHDLAHQNTWSRQDLQTIENLSDSLVDQVGSYVVTLCLSIGDSIGKYHDCTARNLSEKEYSATQELADLSAKLPALIKPLYDAAITLRQDVAYPALAQKHTADLAQDATYMMEPS